MSNACRDWCRDDVMEHGLDVDSLSSAIAHDLRRIPVGSFSADAIKDVVKTALVRKEMGVNALREEIKTGGQ